MTAYDKWRLSGPEEPHEVGVEDGETCNRYHEVGEDAPRGYRPRPCKGLMTTDVDDDEFVICDTCGEVVWSREKS